MNSNLDPVTKYQLNNSFTESSEEGLNLSEIKNIIFRKLPLIAGCTLAVTSLALLRVLTTPPNYVSGFELLSEPVNIETKVTSINDSSGETREEIANVELDEVQLKILKSPRLMKRVVESLKDKYPNLDYGELIDDLTIEIITNNQNKQNILSVSYANPNPQKVSDVINTLTQTYLNYSVEKRQSGLKRGIAFLNQQIPRVSEQAKDIEGQIRDLRIQHSFIDPETSLEQITTRIDNLDKERDETVVKLQELRWRAKSLSQELATKSVHSPTVIELATPRYTNLLDRLREIDVEISQKSTIYSENSAEMRSLRQEKRKIIDLIVESGAVILQKLNNQIRSLENRLQTIDSETASLESKIEGWSTISIDYSNLKQKLSIANNKLNEFILQKDALLIDSAQQDAPWQLLTPATEPKISNISTVNYLLLGSTLGLSLGIGLALFLDKYQNIIYSSTKVEEITNLPILGTIPHSPKPKKLSFIKPINSKKETDELATAGTELVTRKSLSSDLFTPSIEAFSSFAANLGLLNFSANSEMLGDANLQSLVITSAIPREGKSTVALNLARVSASVGKRVLLVDTDLRSTERLTKSLGLETEIGLKNILHKDDADLGLNYIQKLPLEENLFILTSGYNDLGEEYNNIDSSRLLASAKMHRMMEEFRNYFDLIIYDLSAIIGFADVNLLAAKTDGIVVVTGLGKIQTAALTEALNQLKLCKAPVLGVAVNKPSEKS